MKKKRPPGVTEIKCEGCAGIGYPPVRQPAPGRRIYPAPCKKCHGKGSVTRRDS